MARCCNKLLNFSCNFNLDNTLLKIHLFIKREELAIHIPVIATLLYPITLQMVSLSLSVDVYNSIVNDSDSFSTIESVGHCGATHKLHIVTLCLLLFDVFVKRLAVDYHKLQILIVYLNTLLPSMMLQPVLLVRLGHFSSTYFIISL
jgi:hypothetical protein